MTGLMKKMLVCGVKSLRLRLPSDDHHHHHHHHELPEGHIWVCVGRDHDEVAPQRLEVETNYLNHPLFEDLLRLSFQEFGYSYKGALRIAVDMDLFIHLLHLLRTSNRPSLHYMMQLQDLIDNFNSTN